MQCMYSLVWQTVFLENDDNIFNITSVYNIKYIFNNFMGKRTWNSTFWCHFKVMMEFVIADIWLLIHSTKTKTLKIIFISNNIFWYSCAACSKFKTYVLQSGSLFASSYRQCSWQYSQRKLYNYKPVFSKKVKFTL